jgi:large subunit ribosomal protein L7/L12
MQSNQLGERRMTKEEIIAAIEQMTVLELAELVKALEEKFGVSAAPMAMAAAVPVAAAAAPAEEVEEQTEFNVILKEVGDKKIQVIKAVRQITNLGLKEAKEVVDGAPSTVLEAVSREVAEDAKAKLEAEGAVVEIK